MSTNRKIAKAYSTLVAASILGHALSLAKEVLSASYFGVSRAMDSFYAALTVPNLINGIFLSPFAMIFIPLIAKHKTKDMGEANRIISSVSNLVFIFLFAASILAFVFADYVIRIFSPGLDAETAANAGKMLRIISVGITLTGAVNILTGVINAFEHFLWPAISGMFITVCTIFFMLFFTDRLGVFVLGWGLLAGTILQFLLLAHFAKKYGFRHSAVVDLNHPEIQKSLNLMFLYLIIIVLWGLNTVVNRYMASSLPAGSITALAYADKLVQVPLIIFSGAIATSIYPFLSAQAAENKTEDIRNTVSLSIRMSAFIFIPLAVTMMILAKPAVQLFFQRGAFDAAATELTSKILVFYCLLLFSNYATAIMARLLFAFQAPISIMKIAFTGLVINIILNFIFIKLMNPPACGIALSTAVSSFITAIIYFIVLKKRISNLHGLVILKSLSRITAFSAVSGLAVFFTYAWISGVVQDSVLTRAITLAASAGAGVLTFLVISAVFKLEEFWKIYQMIRARLCVNPV
ncbi:MAG: murein biosynthesis integral membrane protein MurJ [Elusimicrobia bacterium RIFOXYA12_FULL_51_18]|nr:MAG: murein biosynthesis integral membrane protein MurJ [Elusimicrobia bacterium RIFOXYA12_FULL_51_18]OGS32302.1 MAG: murein biosynthesis integral membrane protein MurJ [Elusimicrobia bacterium RIFOXYA2_FULL_53_38]